MHNVSPKPKLIRIEQASSSIGVSHWTLRSWARQGRVKTVKLGHLRLVPAEELDRIAKHGIPKAEGAQKL